MDGEELGLLGGESGDSTEVAEDESGGGIGGEETPIEGEAEAEAEGQGEGEQQTEEDRGATRALPTQFRKAFREFIAGNPDFAQKYPRMERQLTAALFKAGQADRMGGLQALRTASELLESHGGAEGIAQLAEEREASQMMQEGIAKGDPVFIDVWSQESPDGFKSAARPYLDKLAALDPVAFDVAISNPMVKTLIRSGVFETMGDLKAAIAGEKFEDIQKFYGMLENYFRALQDYASRAKAPDPLRSQRDELDQERQEIANERTKTFYGGVRNEVNNQMMAMINRVLRQELAGRKLQVSTANRIRKQINEDLAEAVNTSPGYADRYKSVISSREHEKAVRFIVAAARQKAPGVIKRVLRDFNLTGTASPAGIRRVATGGGRSPGTGSVVTGRPKTSEVDFRRTDKTAWLGSLTLGHGEAYLLNGKRAKW